MKERDLELFLQSFASSLRTLDLSFCAGRVAFPVSSLRSSRAPVGTDVVPDSVRFAQFG